MGPLRGAEGGGEAHSSRRTCPTSRGGPTSRTRESPVEWAGRLWCPASRRDMPPHPGRRGRPRSAPVACAERWPLSGPAAGSSKWRTRRPGRAGRVSHPHKGKGPFPLRPLLPVTPRCTGRRLGTFVSSQSLGSRPSSGEGILCGGVNPMLSGWRRELGQFGTGCNSPWNLPFASAGRGLFSSHWDSSLKDFFFFFNLGVVKTTAQPKPEWERKRLTSTSSSLDT